MFVSVTNANNEILDLDDKEVTSDLTLDNSTTNPQNSQPLLNAETKKEEPIKVTTAGEKNKDDKNNNKVQAEDKNRIKLVEQKSLDFIKNNCFSCHAEYQSPEVVKKNLATIIERVKIGGNNPKGMPKGKDMREDVPLLENWFSILNKKQ